MTKQPVGDQVPILPAAVPPTEDTPTKPSLHTYLLVFLLFFYPADLAAGDTFREDRQNMIRTIEEHVRLTSEHINKTALDQRVLDVMAKVPRHEFVPSFARSSAYANRPLPIGHGQTISQPYIVALMTDLLKIDKHTRVLEVGTGSGYQAAILGELASEVYTMEIIEPLGTQARSLLKKLGCGNINVRIGDGYYGWEEQAPFDSIIVTAAASHIPPPLIKQLKKGGRMVIPVGSRFLVQHLMLVEKDEKGQVISRLILPVRFVPLTGKH